MPPKISSPASVFEKVLRAFETGGFNYTDILSELKRLLETGASPTELLEILQRRELIEPLPAYAHAEVLDLLNDAVGQQAAQAAVSDGAQNIDPDTAPASPESTAAASEQTPISIAATESEKTPPAQPSAVATVVDLPSLAKSVRSAEERIARQHADYEALTRSYERAREAESAAAARATALAADLATTRSEARALRDSLGARDATIVQVRHSLGERDAQLAALQQEHRKTVPALEARATTGTQQLQTDLQAARVRATALESESARHQTELRTVRDSLAARDAQLAALQQEHAKTAPMLEARTKTGTLLEADLQAARVRATALAADLTAARTALESEQSRAREIDKALAERIASGEAVRSRNEEALRESARHQTESRTLRESLAARDATLVQVRHSLSERDAQLAALQQEHAKIVPVLEARAKAGTQLETDLQAARARADALTLKLKASQDAAAVLRAQLKRGESHLKAARTELGAVKAQSFSYFEALRTREWRRGSDQNMFRELDARADAADVGLRALQTERDQLRTEVASLQTKLAAHEAAADKVRAAASVDVQRVVIAQVPVQQTAKIAQLDVQRDRIDHLAALKQSGAAAPAAAPAPASRSSGVRKPSAVARRIGWSSAAAAVLAVVVWFFAHHALVPPQVPAAASALLPKPGTVFRDCPTCPAMTVLPAGRFAQGSAGAESSSASFEKPQHWVTIGRPLAMSTNAVTVDEFQQFIAATGWDMQGCDTYDGEWKHDSKSSWTNPGFMQAGTHPVTCVSSNDAEVYARWLSTKTGHRYRLPSASEWEYAARAGGGAVQPWGSDASAACENANVADESAAHRYPGWTVFACNDGYVNTAPVGSFKANSFGLNDMLGNVFQWTEDCWHADYNGAPSDGSARTDGDCVEHELRGGSWFSTPAYVRANYRNHFAAEYRTSSVGIRLVRDMAP